MVHLLSLFAVYLTIFIFGMTVMRLGLNSSTQHKFKELLLRYTDKTWKSFLLGMIITAVVQSSSAIMVIVVGLVAAGLMSFRQSIGIILGANIGTTISTEIITLEIDKMILPFLLIGCILILFPKRWSFCSGAALFGLGCMFVAMNGFEALASPLIKMTWIKHFLLLTNEHSLIGLGLGTTMTAVIQSSTATTAIVMSLMHENILSLTSGIAIMLGANIGTCATVLIASIGTPRESKLVAFAHIWVNIIGVFLFMPFIQLFSKLVILLTHLPDVQIAHASVLFNVISSLLLLPCAGILAALITKLHGEKAI